MTLPANHIGTSTRDFPVSVTGLFRLRRLTVSATRWWTNGDHPDDHGDHDAEGRSHTTRHLHSEGEVVRYYRHPEVPGDRGCAHCGHLMHDHGWLDHEDQVVCPGDWVVTDGRGARLAVRPEIFEFFHESVTA